MGLIYIWVYATMKGKVFKRLVWGKSIEIRKWGIIFQEN